MEPVPAPVVVVVPRSWSAEQRVRILAMDERALLWMRRKQHPHLTRLMKELTRLGDPRTYVAVSAMLIMLSPHTRRIGLAVGLASGIGGSIAGLLKRWAKRPRPNAGIQGFEALAEMPDAFSFPSGHTTAAVATAVALVGQGTGLGPAACALAAGIAVSRIYLGAHYPLDVAVGALLGTGAGVAARMITD